MGCVMSRPYIALPIIVGAVQRNIARITGTEYRYKFKRFDRFQIGQTVRSESEWFPHVPMYTCESLRLLLEMIYPPCTDQR